MKKNRDKMVLLILIVGFLLLAFSSDTVGHFSAFGAKSLYDIILQEDAEFTVDEMLIHVWYGNLTSKEYQLKKKENVEHIIGVFKELKVRQAPIEDISTNWKELGVYEITMKDHAQNIYSKIYMKDGEYFELNGKQCRIISDVDWESFYYMVVSEYEGEYKEYYTNYPELLKKEQQKKDKNGAWYQ